MKKRVFPDVNCLAETIKNTEGRTKKVFMRFRRKDGTVSLYTYSDMEVQAALFQKLLEQCGAEKGSRVFLIGALKPHWIIMFLAAFRKDVTLCMVDPQLPERELLRMLEKVSPCLVIMERDKYEEIEDGFEKQIPVYEYTDGFPCIYQGSGQPFAGETGHVGLILFSSGTTSECKGVCLSYESVLRMAAYCRWAEVPKKTYLNIMPPHHIAGVSFTLYMYLFGAECYVLEEMTPANLLSAFAEYKPEAFGSVPKIFQVFQKQIEAQINDRGKAVSAVMYGLLAICGFCRKNFGWHLGRVFFAPINREAFGGNVRQFFGGAAAPDRDSMKFFLNMGIDFDQLYGLTEVGLPVASTLSEFYAPGTSGRIMNFRPGVKVKFKNVDKNGVGELYIKTPFMMEEYLGDPELTKASFSKDGYFKSGDLGYLDKKRNLVITGRIKEVVVLANGEKISPADVEEYYKGVPEAEQVVCFSRPSDKGNFDEAHLAVVKKPDSRISDRKLKEKFAGISAGLMPNFRVAGIHIVEKIPANSMLKIKRYELRNMIFGKETAGDGGARLQTAKDVRPSGKAPDAAGKNMAECLASMVLEVSPNGLGEGDEILLDSLGMAELYTVISDKYGVNLFHSPKAPVTLKELEALIEKPVTAKKKTREAAYRVEDFPKKQNMLERRLGDFLVWISAKKWDVQVQGLKNIPKSGTFLICPSHQSQGDPIWIERYMTKKQRRNTCIVCKEEFMKNAAGRFFIRVLNALPVDREGNSKTSIDRCLELLKEGKNIMIFPEGTRSSDGKIGEFKIGAAHLAVRSGKPVLPVMIDGTGSIYPKGKLIPSLRRGSIRICFGKPVSSEHTSEKELTELLYREICRMKDGEK